MYLRVCVRVNEFDSIDYTHFIDPQEIKSEHIDDPDYQPRARALADAGKSKAGRGRGKSPDDEGTKVGCLWLQEMRKSVDREGK